MRTNYKIGFFKTAKTIKEYKIKVSGWEITVPIGSIVNNKTALGFDNNYRFWQDFGPFVEALTGHKNSILLHDLTYYGLNIPAEFCEAYN